MAASMVETAFHQKHVYVLLDGLVATAHKVQSIIFLCMYLSKHMGIKQNLKNCFHFSNIYQYTVDGECALNAIIVRCALIICIIIKCNGKYAYHIILYGLISMI